MGNLERRPMPGGRELLDWNTSEIIRETIWAEINGREKWEDMQGPKYKYQNPYDLRNKPLPTGKQTQRTAQPLRAAPTVSSGDWWDYKQIDPDVDRNITESTTRVEWCPVRHRGVHKKNTH